jgi:hypothetical protein
MLPSEPPENLSCRELRDRQNELFLEQRVQESLDVFARLCLGDFELVANPLHHLRDGVAFGHELPKNRTNRIQCVEGIEIAHAAANGDDDQFAFDLARDDFLIPDKTNIPSKHRDTEDLRQSPLEAREDTPKEKFVVLLPGCHEGKQGVYRNGIE